MGTFYSQIYLNFQLIKNKDYLTLEKEIYSTQYKRFLTNYQGKMFKVYLPYYLDVEPRDKIYGKFQILGDKIFFQEIYKIEKSKYNIIFRVKNFINDLIDKNYSLETSEVVSGILYGREINNPHIRKAFKESGILHITVMSGFNLTILTLLVKNLLQFLPLSFYLINAFTILFINLFIIFTGFQASVIRAGIMTTFLILAKSVGRIPIKRNILLMPLLIVNTFNPTTLINDLGFQLSFLATLGRLYLEEYFRNIFKYKIISEIFSAQIMVIPLLWYKFGELNIFSFLNNILLIPFIPFLMIIGVFALLMFSFYPLNQILNLPFILYVKLAYLLSLSPKFYFQVPLLIVLFFTFLSVLFNLPN